MKTGLSTERHEQNTPATTMKTFDSRGRYCNSVPESFPPITTSRLFQGQLQGGASAEAELQTDGDLH